MRFCCSFIVFFHLSISVLCQTKAPSALIQKPPTDSSAIAKSADMLLGYKLPIKIGRTISFTTDEASYLDVDISPDGKIILFSFLGDLFTVPSSGGIAKQITRGLAINRCPVWSPNGKLIAYESDATGFIRLHVADTSGKFHKVLGEKKPQKENIKPVWLPNSKQISVENEIYHLAGTESVLSNEIKSILGFSLDGNHIYYIGAISPNISAIIKSNTSIDTKDTLLTVNKPFTHFINAKISPDGRWLTYCKQKSYYVLDSMITIDVVSGKEKLLTNLNMPFAPLIGNQHYSFSNDSKYLFIGYGGKIHKIDIETTKNQVIPFSADVNIDLGSLNYNKFNVSLDSLDVKYIRSVNRSPDGKHLVFSALNRIYTMDLPNGAPRPLINQPFNQFQPVYSPDGKWIVYVSWKDNDGGHIWRVPSLGGKPEQITITAGLYQHPAWSPDGKYIVVAKGTLKLGKRDNPGNGQIQIISIKDKTVRNIADTVPLFNQPYFSEDGKQIIYKPDQNKANNKVWPRLISEDNFKNKVVLALAKKDAEEYFPIRQILLSPDRRYLVFMYNENLYLTPITNIGNPQIIFDENTPVTLIRFAKGCIDPNWEAGGKMLSWVNTNLYCMINPDKIIEAAEHILPNKLLDGLNETKIIDVNINPDQIIAIKLKTPRAYGKGTIALNNARIITMQGQKVIENGTVIIKNGIFINVGETGKVSIPKEAKVFDLKGKTIIPGLIDMHSHMYEAVPPDVFLQQSWQRIINLSYGVTSVRDPSGSFDTFGYSELVETGQMIGPRLYTVGFAVRPHYDLNTTNEAIEVVNNRKKMGATVVKQYAQPTRLQRQLLLLGCEHEGLNMTNEVEQNPLYCLGMIKDGSTGVEHNPVWGDTYKDIITLVAKSGTYLTPTLQRCYGREVARIYFRKLYGKEFFNKDSIYTSNEYKQEFLADQNKIKLDSGFLDQSKIATRIKKAGGRIVMGSHGEDQGIGAHWEIWALQMGGLKNMEALETATIAAAEGLGIQNDLGSIEVGKIADLIILNKNPLEDIRNTASIKYVIKAGVLYDDSTMKILKTQR